MNNERPLLPDSLGTKTRYHRSDFVPWRMLPEDCLKSFPQALRKPRPPQSKAGPWAPPSLEARDPVWIRVSWPRSWPSASLLITSGRCCLSSFRICALASATRSPVPHGDLPNYDLPLVLSRTVSWGPQPPVLGRPLPCLLCGHWARVGGTPFPQLPYLTPTLPGTGDLFSEYQVENDSLKGTRCPGPPSFHTHNHTRTWAGS